MFLAKNTSFLIVIFFLLGTIISGIISDDNVKPADAAIPPTSTEFPDKSLLEYKKSCFYAEPEMCLISRENATDLSPCHCYQHPELMNSWICCNITDISMITSCGTRTNWINLHIRNATIKSLDISTHSFQALQSLAITDGRIKKITYSLSRAAYVKCLNVSNNNITDIYPRAFTNLQNFQVLDISNNNLSRIPNLNSHKNLTVDIRGNKLMSCDSLLESITRGAFKLVGPDKTYCLVNQTYNWFNSTDYVPITELERWKQLHSECPKIPGFGNCTCDAERMMYETRNDKPHLVFAVKVDCSNLGLVELPPNLPDNTLTLNVSNNSITSFSTHFHSNPDYQSILSFYADNNKITKMTELEGTHFMESFQKFSLKRNSIDNVPEYLISNALDVDSNPNGRAIFLGGNELICDCNTAKMFKIWLLARTTHIPDYNQILCRNMPQKVIEVQEIKLCQSPHDWTDYIYYLIASEVILLVALIVKVSYDYWVFKTSGYLPWPASKMPKLPCDWLCES